MGSVGGAIWHGFKGFRNSPRGERLPGMLAAVKARSPVLGGNFAVWGGLFSAFDCGMAGVRGVEDPWNAIASGAITGGVLAARGGWRTAASSAVVGGVLLALIEGVGIMISRMTAGSYKPVAPQLPPDAQPQTAQKEPRGQLAVAQ
ncbi:Tim17-domain-containing protein [Gonapodya prolifera JEL478]|uniref:Tim17-domain-containing protein n=1 Tax=Gonapodya prolifera (strain JEL478) TaxID=1344416 RepID=A0A139AUK4_GONPJ|nr:Tim17-domain-containing protein [Gonapodya prolifera JEL478]|eukprot:KXS20165.1 Tim17-domain-containing protein [Gonapodya prolifera JEL478]